MPEADPLLENFEGFFRIYYGIGNMPSKDGKKGRNRSLGLDALGFEKARSGKREVFEETVAGFVGGVQSCRC